MRRTRAALSAALLFSGCAFAGCSWFESPVAPMDEDGGHGGHGSQSPAPDGGDATSLDAGSSPSTDAGTTPGADAGSVHNDAGTAPGDDAGPGQSDMCLEGPNKPLPPGVGGVYYGTRLPTHVPLDEEQIMAVVGIGFGGPEGASCSGTLISDTVVLTARHCTEGNAATSMWAIFGVDDENPVASVRAVQKREHPQYDAALLQLEAAPTTLVNVRPIPIDIVDLGEGDVGSIAEQAGYGRTHTGQSDGRYFVAEVLDGFGQDGVLVVDGEGQHGVCFGDSGGPSMRISPAGDVRVIGTLSWGDPSCVDRDRYTRTDRVRGWIEEWTGPTPGGGPIPCGDTDAVGTCDPQGRRATYCANDQLVVEACDTGEVCAMSETAGGYRCVATSEMPCGAVTAYGQCDGQVLSWCANGAVETRDCASCGERCQLVDNTLGYACVPSECGDLDYHGRCEGDVAVWCSDDGERRSRDCGAAGMVCAWINGELGYFCAYP